VTPEASIPKCRCCGAENPTDFSLDAGKKSRSKPLLTLRVYLAQQKEKKEKPIRDDHPVKQYADDVGLPLEFLTLAWWCFIEKFKTTDKKQRDWPTTFYNYVRYNYLKLWFKDSNEYKLSTTGQTEQDLKNKRSKK